MAGKLSVASAVQRDLEELERRLEGIGESGLAATALTLARELDKPKNSATSKSMCAKALREVMDRLLELVPPEEEKDDLDDLAARRAQRRGVA